MLSDLSEKEYWNTQVSTSTSSVSLTSVDSIVAESHSYFDDLTTVKVLYEGKVNIHLVFAPHTKQYYALKVFPYNDGQPSAYFLREARFNQFRHPNILSIPHYVYEQERYYNGVRTTVSTMLMEYAKYGDLFNAIVRCKLPVDEKLARTYFQQLINGLEFLHFNGAAHLDVKLENLLIGDNGALKLADFDLSYFHEDGEVKTRGTKNFRAPELADRTCQNAFLADIYSAGIMLFLFKTEGNLPYLEDGLDKEDGLPRLKETGSCLFWEKHTQFLKKDSSFFSDEFRKLFLSMTKFNPQERATIPEIKASVWYQGPVYTKEELCEYMKEHFGF